MDPLDATTMRPPRRSSSSSDEVPALVLSVAWHPDATRVGESATFTRQLKLSRLEPEFDAGGSAPQPLADPNVSRRPLELAEVNGGVQLTAPEGGSVVAVNGSPLASSRLLSDAELDVGVVIELAERIVLVLRRGSSRRGDGAAHDIVGHSAQVAWMVEQATRVAASDANVLLRGETGSGKELVARAIHRASDRASRAFIAVNMTTLPASTATSQLFGHQKGAFTGAAADHAGFFSAADGGTLFLDEIGETPMDVQAMLLRTLETGEVIAVGSTSSRAVDVRVIAATDANLEEAVSQERFRSPLLHRLGGYQIELPPLRDRREDIGPLLRHFLELELAKVSSRALERRAPTEPGWLSTAQISRFIRHSWPGNVRELRNIARRLAIGCGDRDVVPDGELDRHVASEPTAQAAPAQAAEPPPTSTATHKKRRPEDIDDDALIAALRANQWKTSATATALGISRTSLYSLIERCDRVRKARDIEAPEIENALEESEGDTALAAAGLEVSERGLKLRMKELGLSVR